MEETQAAPAEIGSPLDGAPDATAASAPSEPSPKDLIDALSAQITGLKTELANTRTTASASDESARRAQGQIRSIESRLDKKIESLSGLLELAATRGMDEVELREWKLRRELAQERESRTVVDSESQRIKAEDDFRSFSADFLREEGVTQDNPVFQASWKKHGAAAKDPSDWKVALARAVADVHKDEAKRASDESKSAAEKAREEERVKLRNEKRAAQGPVDNGMPASTQRKDPLEMTSEEFAADSARKREERQQRLIGALRR